MIRVGSSPGKGRGVFAQKRLRKGDLIEHVPVIVIPAAELDLLERTVLGSYLYTWGPGREQGAVALGLGSLYNHADHPNAEYVKHFDEQLIRFRALRDIEEGEEITVAYSQGLPGHQGALWFNGVSWGWQPEPV